MRLYLWKQGWAVRFVWTAPWRSTAVRGCVLSLFIRNILREACWPGRKSIVFSSHFSVYSGNQFAPRSYAIKYRNFHKRLFGSKSRRAFFPYKKCMEKDKRQVLDIDKKWFYDKGRNLKEEFCRRIRPETTRRRQEAVK